MIREKMGIRDIISSDELSALFAIPSASDLDLNSYDGTMQSEKDKAQNAVSDPADEFIETADTAKNQNGILPRDEHLQKSAISLYGSLSLGEILLRCQQALNKHFSLEFITLIQPRIDKTMVTVYSLGKSGKSTHILPHVIKLESSRLSTCMVEKQPIFKYIARVAELDNTERRYLVPTHLCSNDISILYWPLILNGELQGVLLLGLGGNRHLTATQSEFLSHICGHLTIAIKNSDVYYGARRKRQQLKMLGEIASDASGEADFKNFLNKVSESIRKSFDYNSVQIWMGMRSRLDVVGYALKSEKDAVSSQSTVLMVQECWDQNQTLINNSPHSEFHLERAGNGGSWFATPICLRKECIGVLFIESDQLDAFTRDDTAAIQSAASLIAARFYNVRLMKDYQRSGEYLKAVLESADDWAIIYTDNRGYVLTCSVGVQKIFGLSQKEAMGKDVLTIFDETRIQRELLVFMEDGSRDFRLRYRPVAQASSTGIAYLDVSFQRVCDSENHHIGFVGAIRDVTEKVRQERRLRKLSTKDDLTNLNNQRGFFRIIDKEMKLCQKLGHSLSLCFFDLDKLKQFNDTQGHLLGSRAIRETARLLRRSVGPMDICCRYGGDEFVVIMPKANKHEAQETIEKVRVAISEHFHQKITASFGIAEFSKNVTTASEFLARADKALYRAKNQGRNCVVLSNE
jgi:diguanylate cyclase (GGDEF)-like protein/PAS domain S-box-containing protein